MFTRPKTCFLAALNNIDKMIFVSSLTFYIELLPLMVFPVPAEQGCMSSVSCSEQEKQSSLFLTKVRGQCSLPSPHVVGYIRWDSADILYNGSHERGPPLCIDGA